MFARRRTVRHYASFHSCPPPWNKWNLHHEGNLMHLFCIFPIAKKLPKAERKLKVHLFGVCTMNWMFMRRRCALLTPSERDISALTESALPLSASLTHRHSHWFTLWHCNHSTQRETWMMHSFCFTLTIRWNIFDTDEIIDNVFNISWWLLFSVWSYFEESLSFYWRSGRCLLQLRGTWPN